MAVIVDTGDHTLPLRRIELRQFCGNLDVNDVPDTTTDAKLADGDDYVLQRINLTTIAEGEDNFNNFITASTKYAAHLITLGIPNSVVDSQKLVDDVKRIIDAINKTTGSNVPTFAKTQGRNAMDDAV